MERRGGAGPVLAVAAAALGLMLLLFAARALTAGPLAYLPAAEPSAPAEPAVPPEKRVDINTAGLEELMSLPGVGEVKAQAILDDRAANGPFRRPEDLLRVRGFGEATVTALLDYVTTGG